MPMNKNEKRKNIEGAIFLFCIASRCYANWMLGHVGTVCHVGVLLIPWRPV